MPVALEAAEVAAQEGRSLQVVDLRSIVPFDDETVCAAVRSTGRAVVVAEATGFASVSSEIVARVTERCFHSLAAPIRRVTGFDIPFPPPKLEHFQLPGVDRVLDAVDDLQWEDSMSEQVFLLPDLGEGLTEAEIVRWLVAEGDVVAVDQAVVEVETAKSVVEVPTPYAGRVAVLHGTEGATLDVGKPLVTVAALEPRAASTPSTSSPTAPSAEAEAYREEEQAGSGNVLIGYGTATTRTPAAAGVARRPGDPRRPVRGRRPPRRHPHRSGRLAASGAAGDLAAGPPAGP